MRKKLALLIASLFLVFGAAWAQAPVATPAEAITGLLNRIGGNGAADKFVIVIDASLAENGKDVFVITSQNGKPCIKGNTQLSVATGINWYLNHYAHINLTWNNLTTDLVSATLPVPGSEEKHVCNTTYRYNFNTCTFSYSMAFWTWERWQQEIDWMALHGINAPLNLVGLDVVTRNFLSELGVSDSDINAYIAGPGFIAWFAMNNLEGWGGTINSASTGVNMSGNPGWWYTRQENLCRNMLQRMRELGMQPVIPGFSGQVPNCITNYNGRIDGFNSAHVLNNGTWAGGFTRPDMLYPNTTTYEKFAAVYYKHLHDVMGVSELYSIDPFHEGGKPAAITNAECYPNIMKHLDIYHDAVDSDVKNNYRVNSKAKWIIQYWQGIPETGAFSSMSSDSYKERFIGLDLFADNIYAGNAAKWREANINNCYYKGRPYIYCMLHNFGGRSGMHGRLETTMDGYFQALAKGNNCQGIGATPEGIETNPILYDMLFELPWMDVNNHPTTDEWLAQYNQARYGTANEKTLEALKLLKKSVWDCKVNQQGTSEAVILARPNWTVGSVSTWSTSAIYWDTQDVLEAADLLVAAEKLITSADGIANYNYDVIDVIRQAMVDYAAELLPLINAAKNNDAEYTRLYQLYLQLMLDLDTMLSYDENFKLERWTSLARNIADEVSGTTENDRNWLEWNARTQITVWADTDKDLHDYSNRCWAGLIKDFHYKRWEKFFTTKGGSFSGGWFSGFEYPWTVDFNNTYNLAGDYSKVVIPTDMTATQKAVETFGKYFGRVKGANKNYIFPMGITRKATKSDVIPEVYRGQTVDLPLEIGKNVTITSVWVDLNNDGAKGNGETLTATDNQVAIPADAKIGKTTAQVVYSDGTDITFNLALIEDITENRTVTAVAGANGSVAIEGTNELSITNAEAVKLIATANTGYNFENWTKGGEVVSNDNPFIYYGKEAATFTANFIQDKWGVPAMTANGLSDAVTNNQYVSKIDFAYYNREAETIYDASTAPTSLFTTIPQIINVPQGASFTVSWTDNGTQDLTKCFLSAYMDFDGDGNFEEEGELVKVVGTRNADNASVRNGSFQVVLPYDAPKGITHLRMRFDSAWGNQYNSSTEAFNSKGELNRMCYELIINVTDGSAKAAHVIVESNNDEWGTAEVWTDETPGWTASNEWDVSASIPVHIKATKASEDVEFLGWYDHYGRLLTTDLEYAMLAREDATYTARFRKFLEIDGWNIEYRTEPGTEIVTTKLANGVNPKAGKTYYINADVKQTDGTYIARYLYDNGGTLATNTSIGDNNYLWTCIVNDDNTYSFRNASGSYLANNKDFCLTVGSTAAKYSFEAPVHDGVQLLNATDGYTGSKYMVTSTDGKAFNRNSGRRNDGEWCADYVFTEVSTPDLVIFTKVRENGNNDLVIPETVDILGEQCKIVGFDNGVFNKNKELWSITMPQSMKFLSEKSLLNGTMIGAITPGAGRKNAEDYTVYTLPNNIVASDGFKITVKGITNGNCFNQWGSGLFATGTNPLSAAYQGGFQFYLAKDGSFVIKVNNTNDNEKTTISDCNVVAGKEFTATITYKNGTVTIDIDNGNGQTAKYTKNCTLNNISAFSAAIPTGITLNVNVETNKESNPFSGCSNLDKIAFDGDCANYYVNGEGDLYNSSDVLVCSPEGKAKGAARRELAVLIEKMKSLTAQVATYNPVGKTTEIPMQSTQPAQPYYIWCSNVHDSGDDAAGGVAALLDENDDSYLHTDYTNVSATNDFLQVELGSGNGLYQFKIAGKHRKNAGSDIPKKIEILGSTDKNAWETIAIVDNITQNAGAAWESQAITATMKYPYLKFVVTTGTNRIYFHMAKFDLFKLTSTATLHKHFVGTALTADFAAEKYDVLLEAIYAFDHATTADEVQNALTALQTAYTALENKIKEIIPVKFTLDENNPVLYKIFIKRTADVTVLRYDNADGMVAVENTAANKTWQAWYFMGSTNGVTIHPYNADGKKLGATNTGNGAGKVSAVDEATYDGWTFLKQSDGYFNLRASNGAYFSHWGNNANKMGFWDGDGNESTTQADGGSLFKFEEVTFPEDNPRFYQLSDYKAIVPDGTNIYEGTTVGLYVGGKNYREAYTVAKSLVTAGNTSDAEACHEAYKNLRAAKAGLSECNDVDPNKLYIIKSVANNAYCKGKYVHPLLTSEVRSNAYWGDKTYDHRHLVYTNIEDVDPTTLTMWQFTEDMKMKNLHTGEYVKSFAKDAVHMGGVGSAATITITGIADGQVTLKIGNNDPMHAQQDYGVIVQWGASVGNASTWAIEEVNMEDVVYTATIGSSGYAGLHLNYPVVIPDDFEAYYVDSTTESVAKLSRIEGVIPANEGVLLKGEAKASCPLKYSTNPGTDISGSNILKGANYTSYLLGENGWKYFLFGVKNSVAGFYWSYLNYNANGTIVDSTTNGGYNDNGGYFRCTANKIYLPIENTNAASFTLRFNNPTVIEDLLNGLNNEEVIYDIQGRRITKVTESGIYIVNGQKRYIHVK